MRLGYISLLVFSLLLVAWVVLAPTIGQSSEPVPNTLLMGVLLTIVSLGLWQLDSRVAALERKSSDQK